MILSLYVPAAVALASISSQWAASGATCADVLLSTGAALTGAAEVSVGRSMASAKRLANMSLLTAASMVIVV